MKKVHSGCLHRQLCFEDSFHENSQNLLKILGNFYLLFSCMYQEQLPAHLLPESGNASQTGTLQEIYFRRAVEYLEHNFSYPVKLSSWQGRWGEPYLSV